MSYYLDYYDSSEYTENLNPYILDIYMKRYNGLFSNINNPHKNKIYKKLYFGFYDPKFNTSLLGKKELKLFNKIAKQIKNYNPDEEKFPLMFFVFLFSYILNISAISIILNHYFGLEYIKSGFFFYLMIIGFIIFSWCNFIFIIACYINFDKIMAYISLFINFIFIFIGISLL